jgi:hypothetical protein
MRLISTPPSSLCSGGYCGTWHYGRDYRIVAPSTGSTSRSSLSCISTTVRPWWASVVVVVNRWVSRHEVVESCGWLVSILGFPVNVGTTPVRAMPLTTAKTTHLAYISEPKKPVYASLNLLSILCTEQCIRAHQKLPNDRNGQHGKKPKIYHWPLISEARPCRHGRSFEY